MFSHIINFFRFPEFKTKFLEFFCAVYAILDHISSFEISLACKMEIQISCAFMSI